LGRSGAATLQKSVRSTVKLPAVKSSTRDPKPRSRFRKWLRRILFGVAIFFLLVVVLYLFRGPLLSRPLARLAAGKLSDALNGTFTIERIEGDWFNDLTIVGLRTEKPPVEGPIRELTADRVVLSYSLWELISDPINAVESLALSDAAFTLDLTAKSDEVDKEPFNLNDLAEW
jgi:hypothetical protein